MFTLEPLPRTLAAACRDVHHRKESVRLSAVRDLARLVADGHADALEALTRAVALDPAPAVRGEASIALADARATSALDVLLTAAADEHPRVRQMALVALGELGARADGELRARILARLEAGLTDEAAPIRYQSLIGWARLGGDAAFDAVRRGFFDSDPEVRHVALRLAEERWFEDGDTLTGEAITVCERALRDDSPKVVVAAAVILGRARAPSAPKAIARAVATRHGADQEDIQMAIELAGELGVTEARAALSRRAFVGIGLARDPLSWHARIALARLGDSRARAVILKGLDAWSRDARSLAAVAAGRARLSEALPILRRMSADPRRAEPSAVADAIAQIDEASEHPAPRTV